MANIKRILVPVDFSDCSRVALERAVELAGRLQARVDVLHVWEPPRFASPDMLIYIADEDRRLTLSEFARLRASEALERFIDRSDDGRVPLRGRLARGEAAATIVRIADEEHYDLVVLGTHGRTGLSHLLMGSVAQKVVQHASCPVLTVRAPQAEAERPSAH